MTYKTIWENHFYLTQKNIKLLKKTLDILSNKYRAYILKNYNDIPIIHISVNEMTRNYEPTISWTLIKHVPFVLECLP